MKSRNKRCIIISIVLVVLVITLYVILKSGNRSEIVDKKPMIYIYPKEESNVTIRLGNENNVTHTYPKYLDDGWHVRAKVNGDLIDLKTGKTYYALYWEGISSIESDNSTGFVVAGNDTIEFLEEKLAILGLNAREINEYIVYWLPALESNTYNYIRFQSIDEINENMPLEITPKPDTVIRVMMEYKGLDQPIKVNPQTLITPKREGYVVVEWGGLMLE